MSVVIFKFFIFFSDFQDVSGEENMIRLDTTIKNFHEWPRRPPPSPFCCCRPRQGNSTRSSRHSCCTKIEAESSPNTYFVQVASKYGVLLYVILHVWTGATSVQCLDLKWAMRKQQQLQRGRGRQRQLESSYLHWSNVLTKFLEILYYTIWNTCFKSNLKTSSVWWWKFCAFLFWYIVRGIFLAMCTAFCCQ